jgi:DNA invertase Pin-like site-specific DNA recombinase
MARPERLELPTLWFEARRPQLDALTTDAHRRKFDAVLVWKFDRFARSVSHLVRALESFNSLGVGFVSLSESLDTSTPTGKMVFTVLGAVAELERSLIAERVRAGLRNARAKGKRLGRPRVDVDSARIAALRARGASWREISDETGTDNQGDGTTGTFGLAQNRMIVGGQIHKSQAYRISHLRATGKTGFWATRRHAPT